MHRRRFFVGFAVVALLLAGVVSTFASGSPDGLERVAEDKGIARTAEDHPLGDGPLADYGVDGLGNGLLSTGLAGVAGVLLVLALTAGLGYAVRRRGSADDGARAGAAGQDVGSRGG
jgi:PDGLE domain